MRLPLERADALFHRIEAGERGEVPVLAFDASRNTTDVAGRIARDAAGNDLLAAGYKVLLVIDDYAGPTAPVAVSQNLRGNRAGSRLFPAAINPKAAPDWDKSACFG